MKPPVDLGGSPDRLLTTWEAARLAGVGATSIKRWADLRLLRCIRTSGGHRRYRREDLTRFLAKNVAPDQHPTTAGAWVDRMEHAGPLELQGEILTGRERLGAWYLVAEEVAEALVELGIRWKRGQVTLAQEHLISEKLQRAIARCAESIPTGFLAPQCVLATAGGDDHTLGLSLVELCLREAGWSCLWLGRQTPRAALMSLLDKGQVKMLALSASAASANTEWLAGIADSLGEACRRRGVFFAIGGEGAWPESIDYGERFHDLGSFRRWVSELSPQTDA